MKKNGDKRLHEPVTEQIQEKAEKSFSRKKATRWKIKRSRDGEG